MNMSGILKNGNTKHPSRRRKWCFTLNNYTQEDIEQLNERLNKFCKKFLFQEEIAPETGTEHLQGAIILKDSKYMTWVKNNINEKAHWEIMRNEKASFDYCKKEETRNGSGRIWENKQIIKLYDSFLYNECGWIKECEWFENCNEVFTNCRKIEKYKIFKLTENVKMIRIYFKEEPEHGFKLEV